MSNGNQEYFTIHSLLPIAYLISLNSIIRSRFIGYHLSLLQHPFISDCESTKNLWKGLLNLLRVCYL
ncbi:hypothetical protein J2780_001743 [Chryseobacterium camelliae]|nr:hypothetical protein [Chryseobacterium camelliae]